MTLRCLKTRVVAGDVVKIVKIAKIINIGLALFSFFVAFFFFLLIGAFSSAGRAASASERTRSSVAVKRPGAFWLVAAFAWSLSTFLTASRAVVAQTAAEEQTVRPAQSIQTTQSARRLRPTRPARSAPSEQAVQARPSQTPQSAQTSQPTQPTQASQLTQAETASRRFDPLRRDALGVQTRYPAVAKIVGRDAPQAKEDGSQTIPLYYGTGTLVAEVGEWGIVLSNWHVVSEARDSIVVKFPTFSSPARVILRDEVWDLAALLVRKPPRVAPIPISQEVPGVGDALWVAGYGKSAGLTEFQIQGGRVQNYALLVTTDDESKEPSASASPAEGAGKSNATFAQDGRFGQNKRGLTNNWGSGSASGASSPASALSATPDDAFYYETLAVDKGVREGDSGGPIFNRYGELAGVLWGSNGESTMGTYCIRAQFFLTQAIGRLATLEATRRLERPDAPSDELLTWRAEEGVPDATGTDVWARTALESSGVHPIAQRPAYVAADGRETPENLLRLDVDSALKRVRTALTVAENSTTTALPPSPPVFSPTFVSQQRLQNCVRPEVAEADFWTTLTDAELTKLAAKRAAGSTQVRETSVIDESETSVRLAYAAGKNGRAKSLGANGGDDGSDGETEKTSRPAKSERSESGATSTTDGADDPTFPRWRPVGFDGENSEDGGDSQNGEDGENGANGESRARDENSGSGEDGESGEGAANVGDDRETDKDANREDAGNKENGEDAVNREDGQGGKTAEDNVDVEERKEPNATDEPQGKKKKEEKRVKFNGVYLNDFQVYLIVCMIFCLFYNAARLMTEADAKKERQKRQKARRVKELD